jgi:hypothetical protein
VYLLAYPNRQGNVAATAKRAHRSGDATVMRPRAPEHAAPTTPDRDFRLWEASLPGRTFSRLLDRALNAMGEIATREGFVLVNGACLALDVRP